MKKEENQNKIELTKNEILIINNFCYTELKNIFKMYDKKINDKKINYKDIEEYKNRIEKLFNKTNKINEAV